MHHIQLVHEVHDCFSLRDLDLPFADMVADSADSMKTKNRMDHSWVDLNFLAEARNRMVVVERIAWQHIGVVNVVGLLPGYSMIVLLELLNGESVDSVDNAFAVVAVVVVAVVVAVVAVAVGIAVGENLTTTTTTTKNRMGYWDSYYRLD